MKKARMNVGRPASDLLMLPRQEIFLPSIFLPTVDATRRGFRRMAKEAEELKAERFRDGETGAGQYPAAACDPKICQNYHGKIAGIVHQCTPILHLQRSALTTLTL
jgi:hypothetical protein